MTVAQMNLDFAGRPSARVILDRIREESRDEAEKGDWFEQLFMRVALQEPEFELVGIWRWPDWPEREALTGRDGRDIGLDLVARRTSGASGTQPLTSSSGFASHFVQSHRAIRLVAGR